MHRRHGDRNVRHLTPAPCLPRGAATQDANEKTSFAFTTDTAKKNRQDDARRRGADKSTYAPTLAARFSEAAPGRGMRLPETSRLRRRAKKLPLNVAAHEINDAGSDHVALRQLGRDSLKELIAQVRIERGSGTVNGRQLVVIQLDRSRMLQESLLAHMLWTRRFRAFCLAWAPRATSAVMGRWARGFFYWRPVPQSVHGAGKLDFRAAAAASGRA